jgi:hypothetical protein
VSDALHSTRPGRSFYDGDRPLLTEADAGACQS